MSEWISVKEDKKPKFLEHVLVCYSGDVVREGFYRDDSNTWYICGSDAEINASHWMPLPEPPKEVE